MNAHGSFIWYELMTRDTDAARAFYEPLIGWSIAGQAPSDGLDYRMINVHDGQVGGVLQLTDAMCEQGGRPCWLAYFGVDDVDATATAMAADGGTIMVAPFDIPGIGRTAMVTDPQGVPFYLMRGASPESSTAYQRMGMGHVSWNELMTTDDQAALAFYRKHLNIEQVGAMPMGELGDYSFIANGDSKGEAVGAVMRGSPIGWSFYFRVPDIQEARERILASGGRLLQEPMEVPGGEWALNAADPEGAVFGLVAPAKEG